jgi:hypothetical protein
MDCVGNSLSDYKKLTNPGICFQNSSVKTLKSLQEHELQQVLVSKILTQGAVINIDKTLSLNVNKL